MHLPTHQFWWHDFLPWLEPVATAIGVCAAIVAAFFAALVYGRERDRDDRAEERERRAQASLVSAWLMGQGISGDPVTATRAQLTIGIRNASLLPVTNLHIFGARRDGTESLAEDRGTMPPDDRIVVIEANAGGQAYTVSMRFTDAAGVSWHRDWRGKLHEIPDFDSASLGPDAASYRVIT